MKKVLSILLLFLGCTLSFAETLKYIQVFSVSPLDKEKVSLNPNGIKNLEQRFIENYYLYHKGEIESLVITILFDENGKPNTKFSVTNKNGHSCAAWVTAESELYYEHAPLSYKLSNSYYIKLEIIN